MLTTQTIITRLENIYAQIPPCNCTHCHHCCGPIVWFKPEELNIREYLKQYKKEYLIWSSAEFQQHNMRCPYLENDRCIIYPVRPIVCRLQSNIPELPCKNHKNKGIPKQQSEKIKQEMDTLVRETEGIGYLYGTRKTTEEKEQTDVS